MDTTTTGEVVPVRQTAAERRALPDFRDVAEALADEEKVCRRPVPMRVENPRTFEVSYVGAPCKSTVASVCPACAAQARYLRMTQCREGWHLDHEPVQDTNDPTEQQKALLAARADLFNAYQQAKDDGDQDTMSGIREVVGDLDREMREGGFRGRLPDLDVKPQDRRSRSTRRRQDVPDLPRKKVAKHTIGQAYAGKHRPGMFITLTMPSYGGINRDGATDQDGKTCSDGSPRNPDSYDYVRAARDIVHFSALFDRWIQNLRRAVGYDVQYFATVEPQRRGAPHLHVLLRTDIPRELIRRVTAATYHQVWWPHFDQPVYDDDRMPVWDHTAVTFVDPRSRRPLPDWDGALDVLDTVDDLEPAHTLRFGEQVDPRHIRGVVPGTEADKTIGYVTKYLTKSIAEVLHTDSARTEAHYDRLHAELQRIPCSPRCPVWLRYGIVPKGASDKTIPGRCKGKAHRRDTLGLPGRRILVSRRWSGKTLPDHKADRAEFVRQLLADVGIVKPDTSHLVVTPVEPGDQSVPPRDHLILAAIAQRTRWRAEYTNALLAAGPPAQQELSAIRQAA
ncbi:replication initiator [Nocardia sp. NPDC047648]|uniref:replication initiator n=1 Tax=Nocardia sp. NPDC047648 TaxID=3155625 RepID=UPI003402AF48